MPLQDLNELLMIQIEMKRSGGLLGKTLQSSGSFEIDEEQINKQIAGLTPSDNPQMRDGFLYSIRINDTTAVSIDPSLAKGAFKKILNTLEDDLKPA